MKKIIDITIDTGLIFLIVLLPLAFGSVHIWAYTSMEVTVFLLLIIWAFKKLFLSDIKIEKELLPVYVSFLLFILIVYLQTVPLPPKVIKYLSPKAYELYSTVISRYEESNIWRSLSMYTHATKTELIKFISYTGIFFLITQEVRDRERIKRLLIAFMLVGFFESFYGLFGYFSKYHYIWGFKKIYGLTSATGTYLNRNHFSGFLGMTVFMSIGYLLSKAPRKSSEVYGFKQNLIDFLNTARASKTGLVLIMIITMILGICFSLSRMGVFSLIVTLLFILFLSLFNRQKKLTKIIFLILSLGILVSFWYGLDPLEKRYSYSSESLFKDRLPVWSATGKLIGNFPLTGTGLGTYEAVFQKYKPVDFKGRLVKFTHAHNDYLEIVSDVGITGIVPALSGGIYFLIMIFKRLPRRRDPFARGVCLGGIGAIVYICLHSITDFNMRIPANAMTFFIITALTYCSVTLRSPRSLR